MSSKKESKSLYPKKKVVDIYMNNLITKKIIVPIIYVNANILQTLQKIIATEIEGKCIVEGYIKHNSVKVMTYSSGLISGANVVFEVIFECLVCNPVEGMNINCIVRNITKAGIRAEINEEVSPLIIFIARDHHHLSQKFSKIKDNEEIRARVIGQRFELNDKYISVIAELIDTKENLVVTKKKPKLVLKSE